MWQRTQAGIVKMTFKLSVHNQNFCELTHTKKSRYRRQTQWPQEGKLRGQQKGSNEQKAVVTCKDANRSSLASEEDTSQIALDVRHMSTKLDAVLPHDP